VHCSVYSAPARLVDGVLRQEFACEVLVAAHAADDFVEWNDLRLATFDLLPRLQRGLDFVKGQKLGGTSATKLKSSSKMTLRRAL